MSKQPHQTFVEKVNSQKEELASSMEELAYKLQEVSELLKSSEINEVEVESSLITDCQAVARDYLSFTSELDFYKYVVEFNQTRKST